MHMHTKQEVEDLIGLPFSTITRMIAAQRGNSSDISWTQFNDMLPEQEVSHDILPWPCFVAVDEDTIAIAGYKPSGQKVTPFKGRHAALIKITHPKMREYYLRGEAEERSLLLDKAIVIKTEGPFTGQGWIRKMADFCRRP